MQFVEKLEKQMPLRLNFTPTGAKTALAGRPGSFIRDNKNIKSDCAAAKPTSLQNHFRPSLSANCTEAEGLRHKAVSQEALCQEERLLMRPNRLSTGLRATLAILTVVLLVTSARAASHQVLHSFTPGGSNGAYPTAGLIVDATGNRYGTTNAGGTYNAGTAFEFSSDGSGGWTEKVLYNFGNGTDGVGPEGRLLLDGAGNLYGTTFEGGIHGLGTAFELSPNGSGGWTERVLHSFGKGADGSYPYYNGLIFDGAGNLYGTTQEGGIHGGGTVFELSPNGSGGWTETVLHSFGGGTDGYLVFAGLIFDGAGNLYGTTFFGGIHGWGTVFELSPRHGGWTETVLHSFDDNGTEGIEPVASLILDSAGNLYGTTQQGGIHGDGTVVELSPRQGGGWTETVLHSFGRGTDGISPNAGLIFDAAGNLYGTTQQGGIHGWGTAFELSPRQGGGWIETVLHSFNLISTDGAELDAGLNFDADGNLYSVTVGGGSGSVGTMFQLSPRHDGGWTETVLYNFHYDGTDGTSPAYGSLISDAARNLYGTTGFGGAYESGVVFELTRNRGGGWTEKVLYSFGKDADASNPETGLIMDAAGNLYGTTFQGGIHNYGTVFKLSPAGGGWTEKILHNFNFNGTDGAWLYSGLVFDRLGNLYGTTLEGGIHGYGTVFELSPNGSGGWTETVLHSFNFNGTDGAFPYAGLTIDAAGNLYGTTRQGGIHSYGTAFEMSFTDGAWREKLLHSFNNNGADGAYPFAGLVLDAANNLYGTTGAGGIHGFGTVFQLTPNGSGGWAERVLHSFNSSDGAYPTGGLIFYGLLANLYGTTSAGGVNDTGTVFELTPTLGGNWIETVLHDFGAPNGADGNSPEAGLLFDITGNLYGTTALGGGTYNSGTVFEIGP
jgi:uncharacterized repeat protein (TIGR03803 family)